MEAGPGSSHKRRHKKNITETAISSSGDMMGVNGGASTF